MSEDPSAGLMHDAGTGLCAGCVLDMHYGGPACGNDAVRNAQGTVWDSKPVSLPPQASCATANAGTILLTAK